MREYERVLDVVHGWERQHKFDCFIIRKSTEAAKTYQRVSYVCNTGGRHSLTPQGIPAKPPFFGAPVQVEGKKGKWSKRWLDIRGGHAYLAKKEGVSGLFP